MIKFSEFTQEELRKFQLKSLEMLTYFDSVCTKYGLTYSLNFGSCLGAVREHNFIAWDDDLDVMMPRGDYEKLGEIFNEKEKNERYVLCRPAGTRPTGFHITQLRDAATTCIYKHSTSYDICHGIKMDICAIDGCPEGKIQRFIQKYNAELFALFAAQRVPNHASKKIKWLAKMMLSVINRPESRYKIWSRAEKAYAKYAYDSCEFVRIGEGDPFKKEIFGTPVRIAFENGNYPVPEKYGEYLTLLYGNYMELPPEEDRHPETEVVCLDLEKPYTEYRGRYYLCKE